MELHELDLNGYLQRIGYNGPIAPTLTTLTALQKHHVTHIPFENIDVQLGRPILLDLPSLQRKLVREQRGGYCFEHNTLFAAVLAQLGFSVATLAARVRYQATQPTPRTHMLLLVTLGAQRYLVDTAFGGGWGPTAPLTLSVGELQHQELVTFQLQQREDNYTLSVALDEALSDLYEFTLEPHVPVDYELANYFTSTHPASRFVQALIVTMPGAGVRYALRNEEFTIRSAHGVERRAIRTGSELRALLRDVFGIALPEEAHLRALTLPP